MTTANIFGFTDTWNNISTTFNGIKLDVTDSASASDSALVDLQVGSVSQFKVDKGGIITANGFLAEGNVDLQGNRLVLDADNDSYIDVNGDDSVSIYISGTEALKFDGAADDKLILDGVSFSPTGAVVGQALGFPNSTTTLEPYTPAGGGDTLAAANETVTGDWTYTGDLNYTATGGTVAQPAQDRAADWLTAGDFSGHQAFLRDAPDALVTEAGSVSVNTSSGKQNRKLLVNSTGSAYGIAIGGVEDISYSGVIEASDAIFPMAVSGDAKRFSLNDLNISSGRDSDSWMVQIKPGLSGVRGITSIDTSADTISVANASTWFSNGDLVRYFSETTDAAPLVSNSTYYVINVTTTTLQLSLTEGGAAINITTAGAGTQTLTKEDLWAEQGLVYGNLLAGVSDDVAMGVSVDGDTRNVAIGFNTVENVRRVSNASRSGHAYGIAGQFSDVSTSKDCYNTVWVGNVATDADNFWHAEDPTQGTIFALNAGFNFNEGFNITNGDGIDLHLYLGNSIRGVTDYFVNAVGTGSTTNSVFAFNLCAGGGVTQAPAGNAVVRINQIDTKNINYIGNVHDEISTNALESDAEGPINYIANVFHDVTGDAMLLTRAGAIARVSYNCFDTVSSNAIVTSSSDVTSLSGERGVLVESNNSFEAVTGSVMDLTACAKVIGDQQRCSPLLDASIESDAPIFVAQRDGEITAVTIQYQDAGGGGTADSTFTLYAGATKIIDENIVRSASQYDEETWTAQNAAMDANTFSAGDLIRVEVDGSVERSGRFIIQVEFFYKN